MRTVFLWGIAALVAVEAQRVSNNGRCGLANKGLICRGSSYGNCCSQFGWCGHSAAHCGFGCDPNYGTCSNTPPSTSNPAVGRTSSRLSTAVISNVGSSATVRSSTRSSSPASPSSTVRVSKNARCGYVYGATGGYSCQGSVFGNCCSQYSYCGSTSAYCEKGCQPGFGSCNAISMSSNINSAMTSRSSSAAVSSASPAASSATPSTTFSMQSSTRTLALASTALSMISVTSSSHVLSSSASSSPTSVSSTEQTPTSLHSSSATFSTRSGSSSRSDASPDEPQSYSSSLASTSFLVLSSSSSVTFATSSSLTQPSQPASTLSGLSSSPESLITASTPIAPSLTFDTLSPSSSASTSISSIDISPSTPASPTSVSASESASSTSPDTSLPSTALLTLVSSTYSSSSNADSSSFGLSSSLTTLASVSISTGTLVPSMSSVFSFVDPSSSSSPAPPVETSSSPTLAVSTIASFSATETTTLSDALSLSSRSSTAGDSASPSQSATQSASSETVSASSSEAVSTSFSGAISTSSRDFTSTSASSRFVSTSTSSVPDPTSFLATSSPSASASQVPGSEFSISPLSSTSSVASTTSVLVSSAESVSTSPIVSVSESSSSILSSSSSVSSSTISASTLSSTDSTASISTLSLAPSSTPTPTPSTLTTLISSSSSLVPSCFSPQATNYVVNPGFETSGTSIAPWNKRQISPSSGNSMVVAPNNGATVKRSGAYGLRGQTTTTTATIVEIYQTITDLDPGTSIHVGGYVRSLRGGNPPTVVFTLLFDNTQIDKFTNVATTNNVYQMLATTSSIQVTGGSTHTLVLRVETSGITGPVFAADDFYIIVESGPGGVPVCNPTAPPPRECYSGQTGVNLVKNPGFDNGLDNYLVSQTGNGFSSDSSVVDYAGNPSGNGFRGLTITGDAGKEDSTLIIFQGNIDIPENVTCSILVDVYPKRAAPSADKPYSIAVWYDNIALSTFTSSFNGFFKLGSSGWPITGPGPHSISLVVRTGGIENAEIFYADNFEIKVTKPTNGSRICGT